MECQKVSFQALLKRLGKLDVLDNDEAELEKTELRQQVRDLKVVIGLRCLSVLRYLSDHVSHLSLGVLARLTTTHDTPGLLARVMHTQPWRRRKGSKHNTEV